MVVEKRKFQRAKIDCEILYPVVIVNDERKTFKENSHLFAVDISEAGICLCSTFFIPEDCFMSFYLRLEDNLPFRVLLKVRWTRSQDGLFISGGEFLALNLEEMHTLRQFVLTHPVA